MTFNDLKRLKMSEMTSCLADYLFEQTDKQEQLEQ